MNISTEICQKILNKLSRDALDSIVGADMATTETTTQEPESIDLDQLRKLIGAIPLEPYAEFMKEQGYPPSEGWVMLIPSTAAPEFPPNYVKPSRLVTDIFFYKPEALGYGL